MSGDAHRARKQPKQHRSQLLVEAILEAAARTFERHGYAHTTTNRIAAAAGISIGSLYQYFPNKDAILVALMERHIEESVAVVSPRLAGLSSQTPVQDALTQMTEAMVELHRRAPALHRVLAEECPRPASVRERLETLFDRGRRMVARLLEAHPDVEVADTETAAKLVVQVIESVTHELVIHHDDDDDVDRITRETVRMLAMYLSSPTPGR